MFLLVAVGTVAILEVDDVKVTPIHEGVVTKVASTSVAVEIVAPESLTVVDVIEILFTAYQLVLWGGEDLREQSSKFCSA